MFTEDITAIVLDPGSQSFRAGYSGEDHPKFWETSHVGVVQQKQNLEGMDLENMHQQQNFVENQGAYEKKYYAGDNSAKYRRDFQEMVPCFERGQIKDEGGFLELLSHIYSSFQVNPGDYGLLVSESSLHNVKFREKLIQLAFENLQVPNLFVVKSAVLSAFSSGRSNALVLDSGAQTTMAVPVFEGFALQKNIQKYEMGGETVTQVIQDYVEKTSGKKIIPSFELSGQNPTTTESFREFFVKMIARDVKEAYCQFEDKSQGEVNLQENFEFVLPDGNQLNLDKNSRSDVLSFLFQKENKNENIPSPQCLQNQAEFNNYRGIHHMILDSINSSDIDIKKELYQNILLCGGNTIFAGFQNKVQNKLAEMVPNTIKTKIISYQSPVEKKFSSWIGGSILASLGSFQSMWVTKKEYQESGSSILEKKCP